MVYCLICKDDIDDDVFDIHTEKLHPLICGACGKNLKSLAHMQNHMEANHPHLYKPIDFTELR